METKMLKVTKYNKDLEDIYEVVYKSFPKQIKYVYGKPTRPVEQFLKQAQETYVMDEKHGATFIYT